MQSSIIIFSTQQQQLELQPLLGMQWLKETKAPGHTAYSSHHCCIAMSL
jgi:hypothetical protein